MPQRLLEQMTVRRQSVTFHSRTGDVVVLMVALSEALVIKLRAA